MDLQQIDQSLGLSSMTLCSLVRGTEGPLDDGDLRTTVNRRKRLGLNGTAIDRALASPAVVADSGYELYRC